MAGIAIKLAKDREAAEGLGSHERAIKYLNQDYETLRNECLEAGALFQDPSFPALPSSLGYKELGPYSSKTRGIYEVPEELTGQTNIHLGKNFFLTTRARERSDTFINLREVLNRFKLPPGEYVLVPSTFEPHKDGDFCIRVFSEKKADYQAVDDEIEANIEEIDANEEDIDDGFRRLFVQLAGEDAEISAFELQTILRRVLAKRQDIKSDGFSIETCKIMVDMLDEDGSGKLGLKEFYILWTKIQKYQKIYREIDVDRSGTMNSYEMRKALEEAGFKLPCQLHQVIVARFADDELIIDFDNFVRCLVRLETLFKIFKQLDPENTGTIQLNLASWLSFSVL